jgi:catechol 2,3-dioxygenase
MAIPATNFSPAFNVTRASHIVFTARDLKKSRDFYTEVIGLVVSDEDANTIWFRGTEERAHHSLTLKKTTEQPICERVGFRVFTNDDIEKAKAHFDKLGIPSTFVDVPYQTRTLHVADPAGTPLELCVSMENRQRLHARLDLHRGGRAMRLDHYQVLVPDLYTNAVFYTGLGFRVSDYMCIDGTDDLVGIFLHRKDNPWDMVFLKRPGPRFHHVGYCVESMHDMIRACDVAGNLGFAPSIEHGPGRHGHQHSYFTYIRDPDGHRTELLLPAIQVTDIEDEPVRFTAKPGTNSNLWGFLPPSSWLNEATPFAVTPRSTAKAEPATATA